MPNSLAVKPRWKKLLLLQVLIWPALFLVTEVIVRFATDYDSEATRVEVSEIVESMLSGVPDPGRNGAIEDMEVSDLNLHPYMGVASRGALRNYGKEILLARKEPPTNEYRIMVLGGSVAGGFGNPASAGIGKVRKALMQDSRFAGRSLRFIAMGHGSYKQPQQLNLANYLIASGVRPHAIINLDGFNEVALALTNASAGMNPIYPSYSQWIHLSTDWGTDTNNMLDALIAIRDAQDRGVDFAEIALKFNLHYSSLLGPLVLKAMRGYRWRHSSASGEYVKLLLRRPGLGPLSGPKFPGGEESVLRDAVQVWGGSSRALSALCEKLGIYYLNVLQPTLHDKGSKVLTKQEKAKGGALKSWVRGANLGYPLLREAGQQLREEGINFIDGSMAFIDVKRTLYYDACHFDQWGNGILGELVGSAFLANLPPGELPD